MKQGLAKTLHVFFLSLKRNDSLHPFSLLIERLITKKHQNKNKSLYFNNLKTGTAFAMYKEILNRNELNHSHNQLMMTKRDTL